MTKITVFCDNCLKKVSIEIDNSKLLSDELTDRGWYSDEYHDYCPDCFELDENDNMRVRFHFRGS